MKVRLAVVAFLLMGAVSAFGAEKPNVILFATDDLCDWVGPLGYGQAVTPNMDRLAEQGVVFTNAHTAGVFCAPSRSAIFSGRFASTSGCYTTEIYFYDHPEYRPMQKAFQEGGYETFGAGKLFHHPAGYIDPRGWDEYFLRTAEQRQEAWPLDSWDRGAPLPDPYPNSIYNHDQEPANRFFLEWGPLPNEQEKDMADTIRTEWACDVIAREHDKPFFLALGLYTPHFPNYCPQKYFDLYDADKIEAPAYKADDLDDLPEKVRKAKTARSKIHQRLESLDAVEDAIHGYLACVSYADAMLGRVLDSLENSPHKDNTIVVLWSDHGYHHGEKGDWGKHTLWERTTNVPYIWAGPGVARDASTDATVSLIDMYPTFVDMCGLPRDAGLEGRSLVSVLRDPSTATDRDLFVPFMMPNAYAIVNRDWRYIRYDDGTEELYDVQKDPREWYNLAEKSEFADVKAERQSKAPTTFAPVGSANRERSLVVDGDTYRWEAAPAKRGR